MNKKTVSLFWSFPVLTVYFYAANILTQYGYISYFDIPSSFIESSIKDNIIYFFYLIKIAFNLFGLLSPWVLLIVIPVILMIVVFFDLWSLRRLIYKWSPIVLLIFLYYSYDLGSKTAEYMETHLVVQAECLNLDNNFIYIAPDIYDSKLILVPVDKTNNKIKGGFFVKNSSDINCEISYQKTGRITK